MARSRPKMSQPRSSDGLKLLPPVLPEDEGSASAQTARRLPLSLVIPAMNEEGNVGPLIDAVTGVLNADQIDFEMIFVDDGSSDGTWQAIKKAAISDPRIIGLRHRRNFGKARALATGFAAAE